MCTKLYEHNQIMVGFGYFNKDCFIRLVTINSENTEQDLQLFFRKLEEFCGLNDDLIKKIN